MDSKSGAAGPPCLPLLSESRVANRATCGPMLPANATLQRLAVITHRRRDYATEPATRERCGPESQGGALQSYALLPTPDPLGDITGARGPNPHALLIAQYAVYASIGNRDGMQVISDQLRQFGVTREELADFADHATLHTGSPRQPSRTVLQMEQAWKLSQ